MKLMPSRPIPTSAFGQVIKTNKINLVPSIAFKSIIKANPNGIHYKIKNSMGILKINKQWQEIFNPNLGLIVDAYIFLYAGMIGIMVSFAGLFKASILPIGAFILLVAEVILYLIYILINHLLVKYVIGHKIPLIIETLLLISLILYLLFYPYFNFLKAPDINMAA